MPPRISALLPTADCRRFIPAAIAQIPTQNRDHAELVILDYNDLVADLIPGDSRIRYNREDARRVLGDMRNRLCTLTHGDVLIPGTTKLARLLPLGPPVGAAGGER